MKFLTIIEVTDLYAQSTDKKFVERIRGRILRAMLLGEAGRVQRARKCWLFSEQNLARLASYMKRHWNMVPAPADSESAV
jgi:hypothetical protein